MSILKFECHKCNKESEFNTEETPIMLLDDTTPRPVTYVPNCSHCGAQCSVTPSNE